MPLSARQCRWQVNTPAGKGQLFVFFSFPFSFFSVLMSGYQRVASAFNRYWEDGMGGADGEAIDRLLDEYFPDDVEGGGPGLPGSKHC